MVGVNLLRNNATNMIFENLPLFTSLTITKKCELVCFISIDFEATRVFLVFPVVAYETGAKKTGCSHRLGHFNCSFFIIPKGPIVYYVPEGGGGGGGGLGFENCMVYQHFTHPPIPPQKHDNYIRKLHQIHFTPLNQ